jgi:hypothetical protein
MISVHDEIDTAATLAALDQLAQRMEGLSGSRSMAVVSDGFLAGTHRKQVDELVDHDRRAGITITALDVRSGCQIEPIGDPTRPGMHLSAQDAAAYDDMVGRSFDAEAEVLNELATGTAGRFIRGAAAFGQVPSSADGPSAAPASLFDATKRVE